MMFFYAKIVESISYFPNHIVSTILEEDYQFPKDAAHVDSRGERKKPKRK
jgi:hypothetical protein